MVTQVFSLQYPDEALDCIAAGIDQIGLLVGDESCPACITVEQAKEVFKAVGHRAVKVAIIMVRDEDKIIEIAKELRPDIVHLCDEVVFATKAFADRLKAAIPGIKLMQGVPVEGPESIALAKSYEGIADFIMTDTNCSYGIGASGQTHDWEIDRRIVEEVNIPVVMAGGLGPDNVAEAIYKVRPYAVDSLTRTSIVENGKVIRKDIDKVRAFVENARMAARDITR
ncbi:MAG: phosphoribosylanthranilate isomerase [Christensenellales bacterium]|jgi:phosphoribosylanthranilate isomerase|nr:phosphoribosylanthranilate isomerase [Christensenellaceae bacterium]